jgi:hypothetical protein
MRLRKIFQTRSQCFRVRFFFANSFSYLSDRIKNCNRLGFWLIVNFIVCKESTHEWKEARSPLIYSGNKTMFGILDENKVRRLPKVPAFPIE